MMDWVIGELRYKSCILKATGAINVYAGDVVKSDTAISTDLKLSLRAAVKCLEDIPQAYKDYHPGSGEKVLDLVHPSLFPLMYGYSRVLATSLVALEESINKIGTGSVIKRRPDKEMELEVKPRNMDLAYYGNASKPYSKKYQWLPCEVDISGGKAKYVLYSTLKWIFPANSFSELQATLIIFIPMITKTCTRLSRKFSSRRYRFGI